MNGSSCFGCTYALVGVLSIFVAGSAQQPIMQGQHGLITIPVTSSLAQQLLAANNKRQQPLASQHFYQIQSDTSQLPNASNAPASTPISISSNPSPLFHSANNTGTSGNRAPAIGQLLANQQSSLPTNMYKTQVRGPTR